MGKYIGVTREGAGGGMPRVTPSRGMTPEGKKLWAKWRNEVGQVKKVWGDTLEGG